MNPIMFHKLKKINILKEQKYHFIIITEKEYIKHFHTPII